MEDAFDLQLARRGLFSSDVAAYDAGRPGVLDALEELATGQFGGVVERPYLTPIYLAQRQT